MFVVLLLLIANALFGSQRAERTGTVAAPCGQNIAALQPAAGKRADRIL